MGINGLLPALRSITRKIHISEYSDCFVAVDAYVWLHKAIYSCCQELCQRKRTLKYVDYFISKVNFLISQGVKPYIVFDGDYLPAKATIESEREKSREKNRINGLQLLKNGQVEAARQCFVKAVDVTPLMAFHVIQKLREMNIPYLVAPYEADAQLAYLSRKGLVSAIITEDSDCIPYGCDRVLFKLDGSGMCDEIRQEKLQYNKGMVLGGFTNEMIIEMCILSGCDYLPSIPSLGLKKSHILMKRFGKFSRIIKRLRFEGKLKIPEDYERQFEKARLTFKHQKVFDPTVKKIVSLNPIDSSVKEENLDFLGPSIPQPVAELVANGDIDPISKKAFSLVEFNEIQESCESPTMNTQKSPVPKAKVSTNPAARFIKNKESKPVANAFTRLMAGKLKSHFNGIKHRSNVLSSSLDVQTSIMKRKQCIQPHSSKAKVLKVENLEKDFTIDNTANLFDRFRYIK